MPANVENMFSVKETPWHGIGSVVQNAPSIEEGIKLAGLDWSVIVEPLYRKSENNLLGENVADFAQVFIRSDNQKTLAVVGPKTHVLQNSCAFNFFQPFLDAGEAALETAGSLDEGRRVWVMAKINRDNSTIVKNDEVAKFVLLSNSHDGKLAVRVGFTPIRVVCANTLALAHGDKASKLIRVRHSKDVEKNVEAIRDIINVADETFEATAEQYRYLASRDISVADLKKYVQLVFEIDAEKPSTRAKNMLQEIMDMHELRTHMISGLIQLAESQQKQLQAAQQKEVSAALVKVEEMFENGRGTDNAASRGTYWTAYNAVNEYLNYNRGHTNETRLNSLWFGQNALTNERALKIATDMASGKSVE